jgi:hypothetical protein
MGHVPQISHCNKGSPKILVARLKDSSYDHSIRGGNPSSRNLQMLAANSGSEAFHYEHIRRQLIGGARFGNKLHAQRRTQFARRSRVARPESSEGRVKVLLFAAPCQGVPTLVGQPAIMSRIVDLAI